MSDFKTVAVSLARGDVEALDLLCKLYGVSRSAIIRELVADFLLEREDELEAVAFSVVRPVLLG